MMMAGIQLHRLPADQSAAVGSWIISNRPDTHLRFQNRVPMGRGFLYMPRVEKGGTAPSSPSQHRYEDNRSA